MGTRHSSSSHLRFLLIHLFLSSLLLPPSSIYDPRKKLPEEVEKLQQAYPEAKVELWSQDEHRIGLKPVLRRVWARKGSRVRAVVRHRYQWMHLYGFVEPQSGKTSWLLMPTVNTAAFSLALAAFAQEQGAGPDKRILLVLDQAGWHKSGDLVIPEGLHLLFLPSHSPELQPAERLWPLSNEPLANRVFSSLDELEDVQVARCRWLQAHPEMIRGRTSFHWWPSLCTT
ncbi:IS630 family transposase [Ktedonobacter sp. SOSP1-52]|uniref:IS630 family transposase n=1 Tax=Ktedonobacter sp. SOSP1-52 TaxID=2778366 RepID=UPI00191577A7|nr:IS630 family transposase [Ktedonobacter sp. SOSP1-52]